MTDRRAPDPIDSAPDTDVIGGVDVADLCFTARALAQTHPMSESALRYRQACFESERERQHVSELADWATTAMLVGYCLRRSEEHAVEAALRVVEIDEAELADRAAHLADVLRAGDARSVTLLPADAAVAAIDRIIGSEIHKRHEHLRDQLDDEAWAEFEGYVAWWVVHGYCVRAIEAS